MSALRLDVRKMLLKRGWQEPKGPGRTMEKGRAVWATSNASGDSCVTAFRDGRSEFTIAFTGETPARVIVAAVEAAQEPLRRSSKDREAASIPGYANGGNVPLADEDYDEQDAEALDGS